jgi:hypothetical protein
MPGYPQVARATVKEMHRQVGPMGLGDNGVARGGLMVRHLMMPGMSQETKAILRFVVRPGAAPATQPSPPPGTHGQPDSGVGAPRQAWDLHDRRPR